ncbi:cytochrome P450 [Methylobacterium sp. Leaf108]|uniref:cytochrome P450 n=1 Tax=Methylobacterium sp. Leaf108 TaxID=1736256 RepID=UPI0009E9007C|nr:cytochrome P450 [Methylobacterium sp. Leaf108]
MQIASTPGFSEDGPTRWSSPTAWSALTAALASPVLLRRIVRNMIESWPAEVYEDGLVEVARFGRRTFFVCDPALIRALMVDRAEALVREDFMIAALSPMLGRGILTSDGARWRDQRRTVAPVFRPDAIAALVPSMREAVARTAERWDAQGAGTRDVLDEMMRTTFDIIGSTMLPKEPSLDVAAFGTSLTTYLDSVGWRIGLSMLGAPAWMPHPGAGKAARAAATLRAGIADVVARRRASAEPGDDLLGLMMQARDPEAATGCPHRTAGMGKIETESGHGRTGPGHHGAAGMSDQALTDNLLTFIAAGHETTALAMAWIFRLLAEHPRIEGRLRAEIAAAGPAASPDDLPYARQVVMEAMRLYPPAPMVVRQAAQEIRLGGATIPAGASVHIPVYAIHRHRALWGDPEAFDPDRFAPGVQRDRYGYLPFGAGPRVCIGMGFALAECSVILAGLLPHFRFEAAAGPRPQARFKVTLRPHGGMPLRVVPRRLAP